MVQCFEPQIDRQPAGVPDRAMCDVSSVDCPWYVVYTRPRHEKYVAQQMAERHISCFLPVYSSLRRWKDRTKRLEFPLFPGYLFVQMTGQNRIQILSLPGVVQFVPFQG